MIDIRKLKELVRLMVANELTELDLRDSEEQVTLRRHHLNHLPSVVVAPPPAAARPAPEAAATGEAAAAGEAVAGEEGLVSITSPMIGTFYAAPNPDAPPFVTPGSAVTPETVVCLIEAMKIFNEIKAECSGTVAKVLIENGEPIEFGQSLFLVKPG